MADQPRLLPGGDPRAYIPNDRRRALARGEELPRLTHGAAVFVDISGFTPLTAAPRASWAVAAEPRCCRRRWT